LSWAWHRIQKQLLFLIAKNELLFRIAEMNTQSGQLCPQSQKRHWGYQEATPARDEFVLYQGEHGTRRLLLTTTSISMEAAFDANPAEAALMEVGLKTCCT
jgi:hypothetical protein